MSRNSSYTSAMLLTAVIACSAEPNEPKIVNASPTSSQPRTDWAELETSVARLVEDWLESDQLARDDGYIYTVDIAQLMEYAAHRKKRSLYLGLLDLAKHAVVDASEESFVKGFVAWRYRPGESLNATGTTEALRLVRALRRGAEQFARPDDAAAALEIFDGYRRHGYVDQGVWLIRNYYNLDTRAFASNSYLVDYDPDLTARIAAETNAAQDLRLSERVHALINTARTPSGLLHELVQPELLTALPHLGSATFSPNSLAQLSNSCAVLERAYQTHREAGLALLAFAEKQGDALGLIFDVRTGARHPRGSPGIETYGCLVRLAHRFEKKELARRFESKLDWFVRDYFETKKQPRAFTASELLLTAYSRSSE